MIAIAEEALAPSMPPDQGRLPPLDRPRAAGHGVRHRAVELPVPHRGQLDHPGADGRQRGGPQARGQTLLVGERFARAFAAAGLPEGVFQNLVLTHDQTAEADRSGRRRPTVNFTGSVEGGRRIERAAAGTFATLGLELGGKDPAYVRADANLPHAIENLVDGSFFNSGQSCCGIERIYVHEDVYEAVRRGLRRLTPSTCSASRSTKRRRSARW